MPSGNIKINKPPPTPIVGPPPKSTKYTNVAHTIMVMSTEKLPPVSLGINRKQYPDIDDISRAIQKEVKLHSINALELARAAGNYRAVNTVIAGFLYGLGILEIPREILEGEITRIFSGKAAEANLAAFNSGYEAAKAEGIQERTVL
jgi:Pyruvate/2-oxoacid:ferredoxin oxidoreductase gamma subunit